MIHDHLSFRYIDFLSLWKFNTDGQIELENRRWLIFTY